MKCVLVLFFCCLLPVSANDSQASIATALQQDYQNRQQQWLSAMSQSNNLQEQSALLKQRPNTVEYAKKMWACIGSQLTDEWTLEPASWLVQRFSSLRYSQPDEATAEFCRKAFAEVCAAVQAHHLKSQKISPLCLAIAEIGDFQSLKLLEKIEAENPDPQVQGVAAMAIAVQLRGLGDEVNNMKRRLTLIRKAIVSSTDVMINGQTIAQMAEDELYIIKNLSKGRNAPELTGSDASGKSLKLSDYKGKVLAIVFWNSQMQDVDYFLQLQRDLQKKMKDKPFELIGVNSDRPNQLRELQGNGAVTWRNFSDPYRDLMHQYRVPQVPLVYLLDAQQRIQFIGMPGSFVELTATALVGEIKSPQ